VTKLLCAAPNCRKPGSHSTDCLGEPDKPCRGCLPAPAADGLRLCRHCTNRLAADGAEAAVLWHELGLCLIGAGVIDEVRASNPQPGLNLRETVIDARTTIRHTLVSWTLLISEERGIRLPADHPRALGAYIAAHAQWLSAQPFAADAAGELHELVATARSLRQPSGTRIVKIGACPWVEEDRGCTGVLRALLRQQASLLPSAVTCDTDEHHTWDSTQWTKLGRAMKARAA
jgi:hypothetical protein